jgi:hypothetical protein
MIQLQALRVAGALVGRARQLLLALETHGLVVLDRGEAKEFAAELTDIARTIILSADGNNADTAGAEIVDFTLRRRMRAALATPGDGDAA